jgi:hypothetical protein
MAVFCWDDKHEHLTARPLYQLVLVHASPAEEVRCWGHGISVTVVSRLNGDAVVVIVNRQRQRVLTYNITRRV